MSREILTQNARLVAQPQHSTGQQTTPADLATRFNLKKQTANGITEWHGANPNGNGATKDGFILNEDGTGYDRKLNQRYTSREVAELAGIEPGQYAPCVEWKERNGQTVANGSQSPLNRLKSPAKGNPAKGNGKPDSAAPFDWSEAQTFDYNDEAGELLFQVGRIGDGAAKQIRQRRPDGRGGWIHKLDDVQRVLWRLPNVLAAQTVFICEGEKAATALNAALESAGAFGPKVATTNPQGAGKWRAEFCKALEGKTVCVLPDNDEPGQTHGAAVCASIAASGRAASLKRLDLPELPAKGDVADWLEAGGTATRLLEMLEVAPQWEPAPEPEKAPMFEVWSYKQLRAMPRLSWLIDQILPVGGTSWLTAGAGELKSFWAIDAACCVATGRPFHDRAVTRGNVVYVAAEGATGLPDRLEAWAAKHQTEVPDVPALGIIKQPADVATPEVWAGFAASIRALEPTFIVLDTQSRCSVGRDLNSTSEATVFYDAVSRLALELGAQILIVAHNNRSGQYAGNHQAPAMVDTHLTLKRDGKHARLRCSKQKDGAPEEAAAMDFETRVYDLGARDEKGREITSLALVSVDLPGELETPEVDKTAEMRAAVLDVLRRDFPDGARVQDWQAKCAERKICQRSAFYDRRDELQKRQEVVKRGYEYHAEPMPSPPSPPSPFSPPTDLMDLAETPSPPSPPSPSPVGTDGLADCGLRTAEQNNGAKRKRANSAANSEPYAATPQPKATTTRG